MTRFYRITRRGEGGKAETYARDEEGVLRAVGYALATEHLSSVVVSVVSEAQYVRGTRDG